MQERNQPLFPHWKIIDTFICVRDTNSPDNDWIPIAKIYEGYQRSAVSMMRHVHLGERMEELLDDFIGTEMKEV